MSYGPLGQNVNMFSPLLSTANFTNKSVQVNGMTGSVGFSMTPPAAPGLVVSAGGSVPVGTWTYVIYAVDANGNLSGPSVGAQVTTTTGNQTVTIAPPAAPLGSGAYAAARSSGGGFGLVNVANTAWTANIVDTFIFTNALPGSIGTALQAGINNTNLQTPQLVLTGGGFKNTQSFSGTGNRTTTYPDGNSATTLTTSFTTTAAASDNLSVQGATGSSHCSITPTNASAAADSPGTFISAKTTNQLTVTHPANAGRTWDIMCTAN